MTSCGRPATESIRNRCIEWASSVPIIPTPLSVWVVSKPIPHHSTSDFPLTLPPLKLHTLCSVFFFTLTTIVRWAPYELNRNAIISHKINFILSIYGFIFSPLFTTPMRNRPSIPSTELWQCRPPGKVHLTSWVEAQHPLAYLAKSINNPMYVPHTVHDRISDLFAMNIERRTSMQFKMLAL